MTDDLDTTAVCAAAGCTRPADPVLCQPDTRRLGDWLAQLGTEYELLSAAPSMQGREVGSIGGSTLASQRSPARLDVLALTDYRTVMGTAAEAAHYGPARPKAIGPWCLFCTHDTCTAWRAGRRRDLYDDEQAAGSHRTASVLGVLHGWAQAVRDGRDLAEPVRHVDPCRFPCQHRACRQGVGHAVPAPLTVVRERKLLATHLPWILGQEWAGEFHDEIRALWGLLRRANGHAAPTRKTRCWITVDGHHCTGTVRYLDGAAVCQSCGATATGPDLLRMAAEGTAA